MNKRLTTAKLKDLLSLLQKCFLDQVKEKKIAFDKFDIYAQVLHINYKTGETEQTRIPHSFLEQNLPIPPNSVLQIHIKLPDSTTTEVFEKYKGKITSGLEEKDFKITGHKIIFNNLKILEVVSDEILHL
jgi:hypothetical protein